MKATSVKAKALHTGRWTVRICAALFVMQLVMGVVGLPRELTDWLSCEDAEEVGAPRHVVVLGGSGIPSETGLMRTYYAAQFCRGLTNVTIIVAMPSDVNANGDSAGRMREELVLRGIPAESILMESNGLNTHEQAVNVARMLGAEALRKPLVLVTSPWHARRSRMCFRKQGFTRVGMVVAYDTGVEADMGSNLALRYAIWSNLSSLAQVARELTALLAYRLRDWI